MDIGFDRSGPSVHLLQSIMRALLDNGDSISAIMRNTGGHNPDAPLEFEINPNFYYEVIHDEKINKSNLFLRYFNEVRYAYRAASVYKRYKDIDVVFVQSTTVTFFQLRLIKKFLKCPIVYNVQDIFPQNMKEIDSFSSSSLIYKVMNYMQCKGYKKASRIITISSDMKQTLIECGVDEANIDVIYNWSYSDTPIEISDKDNAFINKYDLDVSKVNVIYAGNIGRMQNVEVIINAAKLIKNKDNIHFYIVGDGVYKRKLETLAVDCKNITFLPFQNPELAESIYKAATINIIPLAKGVIKTALPSKTATCLRANKGIIFCIDKDSEFAKIVSCYNGIEVVNSDDAESLASIICNYQKQKNDTIQLFNKFFRQSDNASKYVDVFHKFQSVKG